VQPGAEQRLLHNVFGSLPVTTGQVQRIPEQRPSVLMEKGPD
jgi:hypothetical protein